MDTPEIKRNITLLPPVTSSNIPTPQATHQNIPKPDHLPKTLSQPKETKIELQTPEHTPTVIPQPEYTPQEKPVPKFGKPENVVTFGNEDIEIKPTKLRYHRDGTAYFYRILRQVPLPDLFMIEEGMLEEGKSSDKLLFDWLIAVTDNPRLVKKYYDDVNSECIEKMIEIFCRLNHIDEKEERKNKRAQERNP